jgi:hypothetical protein
MSIATKRGDRGQTVKMRGEDQVRIRSLSRPDADHIAGVVNADIVQTSRGDSTPCRALPL